MTAMIGPGEFWGALARRASHAAIVTTKGADHTPAGFIALSAAHVSASPAIMSVAVAGSTSALAPLMESRIFAINYLSSEDQAAWNRFMVKSLPEGEGRFDGLDLSHGDTGVPIFPKVSCIFECSLHQSHEIEGTHVIFGLVTRVHISNAASPLVYLNGQAVPLPG